MTILDLSKPENLSATGGLYNKQIGFARSPLQSCIHLAASGGGFPAGFPGGDRAFGLVDSGPSRCALRPVHIGKHTIPKVFSDTGFFLLMESFAIVQVISDLFHYDDIGSQEIWLRGRFRRGRQGLRQERRFFERVFHYIGWSEQQNRSQSDKQVSLQLLCLPRLEPSEAQQLPPPWI